MQAIFLLLVSVWSTLEGFYASVHNTPCQAFDKFQKLLQCPLNNTIYILNHIIEDGFTRISYSDAILGCYVTNSLICSASFPRDKERFKTHVASYCNQKGVCDIKPILQQIQSEMRTKICTNRQEMKYATFRHSVDYRCIPEIQQLTICEAKMSQQSHSERYFKSYNRSEECYCDLKGLVSNIEILESYNTTFVVSKSSKNLESNSNRSWTYNRTIQVNSKNRNIRIHVGSSPHGRFLAKVNGQFSFKCKTLDLKKSTAIGNESWHKRYTEEVLNHQVTSSLSAGRPVAKAGKWSTSKNGNIIITTIENPSQWYNVFTTFAVKRSEKTQMQHQYNTPANEQVIARYVIYIMAGMIFLGLIIMVISLLQKRKEENMLEMILQRLQVMPNSSLPQMKPSSLNRQSETFADITYQQIPVDIPIQINGKSVQNATNGMDNSTRI